MFATRSLLTRQHLLAVVAEVISAGQDVVRQLAGQTASTFLITKNCHAGVQTNFDCQATSVAFNVSSNHDVSVSDNWNAHSKTWNPAWFVNEETYKKISEERRCERVVEKGGG